MPRPGDGGIIDYFLGNIKVLRHAWFGVNFLVISLEIVISTRIAFSTKTVIFAKTAVLVISMDPIEICYFGVRRTMQSSPRAECSFLRGGRGVGVFWGSRLRVVVAFELKFLDLHKKSRFPLKVRFSVKPRFL